MKKGVKFLIVFGVIFVILTLFFTVTPPGVRMRNTWFFNVQEAHDQTDYAILRRVEDTARSMIASYHSDKQIWLDYRDSENQEQQNWASGARMRANRTANTYNEFIRQNRFVWSYALPADIDEDLPILGIDIE